MAPENGKSTYLIGLLGLDSSNACGAVNTMPITQSALKMLTITMMVTVTVIMTMMTWLLPSRSSPSGGGSTQVNRWSSYSAVWIMHEGGPGPEREENSSQPRGRGVAGDHSIQSTHRRTVRMCMDDCKWLKTTACLFICVNRNRVRFWQCYFIISLSLCYRGPGSVGAFKNITLHATEEYFGFVFPLSEIPL